MQVDIPDWMIEEAIRYEGDDSYFMHLASEVLKQARETHPDWFESESVTTEERTQ